jgi:hypothetical protein
MTEQLTTFLRQRIRSLFDAGSNAMSKDLQLEAMSHAKELGLIELYGEMKSDYDFEHQQPETESVFVQESCGTVSRYDY